MGKQPAVVFIARHGARLDQADRNWHASAEDAHDPPLTYLGWVQCQTLGVRISNELHNLDQEQRAGVDKDDGLADPRPPKRRKVIIHTSPYLRCVQTAIAISAGIQHPQNHRRPGFKPRQRSNLSPLDHPLDVTSPSADPNQNALPGTTGQDPLQTNRLGYNTCLLRIDPFLGEWLSPSYFDHISPPPPSTVLMSQAKQALQKPQEEIKGADMSASSTYDLPSMEGEEKENEVASVPAHDKTGTRATAAVGHSLPKRPRNVSFGTELANGARLLNRALQREPLGYSPPIPMYALGASDKIPPGFVAHARDVCVVVDHSWDSQHDDFDWGDGGSFGEEWGSMHRRFRNGAQKMIAHYETSMGEAGEGREANGPEEDEDVVLILVTHQAGCNALIRLFTGAPALHDIGPASLTMAVRKQDRRVPFPPVSPSDSLDMVVSGDFDMKIIASTEHLRGRSHPLAMNSPRLGKSPAFASRRAVGADSPDGFALGESLRHRPSASSLGRSTSQRTHAADAPGDHEPPTGLWRHGSRYSRDETAESSEAVVTPSIQSVGTSDDIPEEPLDSTSNDNESEAHLDRPLPVRSASQLGLWGTESSTEERTPGKRRWTAVERSR